jgi:CRP-like cAMP-binding protein
MGPGHMILIMSMRFSEALRTMATRSRALAAGGHAFHRGDAVSTLFVVAEGRINLLRFSEAGAVIVLQRAGPGDILAEASLFSERYHCDAIAQTLASVLGIPKRRFRGRLRSEPDFAEAWARHLGREIQTMRLRSELLSLKTVAARLDAWLAWHGDVPPKGEWKQLAHEIGVRPEALYREFAKRRN